MEPTRHPAGRAAPLSTSSLYRDLETTEKSGIRNLARTDCVDLGRGPLGHDVRTIRAEQGTRLSALLVPVDERESRDWCLEVRDSGLAEAADVDGAQVDSAEGQ